ncbi:hypothetical protein ACI3L1_17935 [Deinococcus sp. SM5_A1]|uniref:hypothetical protein n=1 Tax=Deinococcus sp. SM5_A1 TaxID=3379094 RepID=UPI0038590BF6
MLLVQNNLSPYGKAVRYAAFASHEARQPAARFGCLHAQLGSRLNAQELEWFVLARQTLSERVGNEAVLERPMLISWQFTAADARRKFSGLSSVLSA